MIMPSRQRAELNTESALAGGVPVPGAWLSGPDVIGLVAAPAGPAAFMPPRTVLASSAAREMLAGPRLSRGLNCRSGPLRGPRAWSVAG
jgi:hypothetical protein